MPAAQSQVRRALELTLEWHEAPSLEALPGVVLPGINDLLGVDATGWNALDLAAGSLQLTVAPEDATFVQDIPLLQELIEQHPLVPHVVAKPAGPPIAFSDVLSRRELERREIYQAFFRRHEIRHQMAFVFSTDPFIAIAVNRRRRDFTDAQRELAALVRPHLGAAHRAIAARERAARRLEALERGLEEQAGAAILLDARGRIEHASARARTLLASWFAAGHGDRLPHALAALAGMRAFERPGARLTVSRIETDPPLLLLDEARLEPDRELMRRRGLTTRESEVLTCVAHGLSDRQIAEQLFLSRRTVQKHLEHVYRKFGVGDRAAAAAMVLGRSAG